MSNVKYKPSVSIDTQQFKLIRTNEWNCNRGHTIVYITDVIRQLGYILQCEQKNFVSWETWDNNGYHVGKDRHTTPVYSPEEDERLRMNNNNHLPFHYMVRASGQGEVWRDIEDKLRQYGWRCTTSEDAYSNSTLVGNWYEERFDISRLARRRPLPNKYGHYFQTTYSSAYNREERCPSAYVLSLKRETHSFPGHQPELDPLHTKSISVYKQDFQDHMHSQGWTGAERRKGADATVVSPLQTPEGSSPSCPQ